MNLTRDRVRSIGWAFVLTICLALTTALTLRVNAVRGQVVEKERKIVAMKRDIQFLEIEYQARANQQQLSALNDVEFGYSAPGAGQYIEGERQLAALGMPRGPGAPAQIRTAHAVTGTEAMPFAEMVSPVRPQKIAARQPAGSRKAASVASAGDDVIGATISSAALGTRLARIEFPRGRDE